MKIVPQKRVRCNHFHKKLLNNFNIFLYGRSYFCGFDEMETSREKSGGISCFEKDWGQVSLADFAHLIY